MVKKIKRKNILWHVKFIRNPNFTTYKVLTEHVHNHPLVYVVSVVPFLQCWWSWVMEIETIYGVFIISHTINCSNPVITACWLPRLFLLPCLPIRAKQEKKGNVDFECHTFRHVRVWITLLSNYVVKHCVYCTKAL